MSEKDIVSMEQHQCPVCGKLHETGCILLQSRNIDHPKFERDTLTGWSLCPEHKKLHEEGYLALVEIAEPQYVKEKYKLEDAPQRTGRVMHVRRTLAAEIFDVDLKDAKGEFHPMMFIDKQVYDALEAKAKGEKQ